MGTLPYTLSLTTSSTLSGTDMFVCTKILSKVYGLFMYENHTAHCGLHIVSDINVNDIVVNEIVKYNESYRLEKIDGCMTEDEFINKVVNICIKAILINPIVKQSFSNMTLEDKKRLLTSAQTSGYILNLEEEKIMMSSLSTL